MPHFYAKKLDSITFPQQGKHFKFLLEARNLRDDSILILAESLQNNQQKIMLNKHKKNGKFLVKFNKHYKVHSKELIKSALKEYAILTNAEIISHNLNANKSSVDARFLLDFHQILEVLSNKNAMLEIGFGSGRHILNLAKSNPQSIIIGLEIYRPAILQVLRQIELLNLSNLFIANIDARILCEILPNDIFSRIFLHFPVPWDKNPQRRVFSKQFLENVIRILNKNGFFELVTDSKEYFDFARHLAKNYQCKVEINAKNAVVSKYEARWKKHKKDIYKLQIFPKNSIRGIFHTRKKSDFKADLSQEFDEILKRWQLFFDINFVKNILQIQANKICKEEYFLHIKSVYEFDGGFVVFIAFGAYYAPSSAYLMITENGVKNLSDIIYTSANIAAMKLLMEDFRLDN